MTNSLREKFAAVAKAKLLVALAGTLGTAGFAHGQVTVSEWQTATSGNWTDAARWSTNPFAPNNGNGNPLYRAEILATGANYTITLNSNIALDSLLLNSANATIAHTSGVLNLTGTATLTAGTFNLNGGTIRGGVIDNTAGRLTVSTNTSNALEAVSLTGGLSLTTGNLRLRDGFSATGTVSLAASGATLVFDNSQTFHAGTLAFTQTTGSVNVAIEGNSTLTIASGATFQGKSATIGMQRYVTGTNSLVNNGLVHANSGANTITIASANATNNGTFRASGSILSVTSAAFVNAGLMEALNGTVSVTSGSFVNSGTLSVAGGSVTIGTGGTRQNTGTMAIVGTGTMTLGGSWSDLGTITQTGGTLNLSGSYDLSSPFTHNRTAGVVQMSGVINGGGGTIAIDSGAGAWGVSGQISNATVDVTGGGVGMRLTGSTTRFTGLEINGTVSMGTAFGVCDIREGLSLDGTWRMEGRSSSLQFTGTQTLDGNATIVGFANTALNGLYVQSGTVTLEPGVLVRGENLTIQASPTGTWDLRGRVSSDVSGGTVRFDLGNGRFENHGVVEAVSGGTLVVAGGGQETRFVSDGVIRAGAGSKVRFEGTRVNLADSTLDVGAGTVEFSSGVLDNTGGVLDIAASGGNWVFQDSRIVGGQFLANGAAFSTTGQLTLESVDFAGQLSGNVLATNSSVSGDVTLAAGKSFVGSGTWTNNAAFTLSGGDLTMRGQMTIGSGFSVASTGGTVRLESAQIDNTGKTLTFDATSGAWLMDHASTITGGTLSFRDGQTINSKGTFVGVTIDGVYEVTNALSNERPVFNGGITGGEVRLTGSASGLFLGGAQTLTNTTLAFQSQNAFVRTNAGSDGLAEVTIDADSLVRGGGVTFEGNGTLVNYGEIRADIAGKTMYAISDVRIRNFGEIRAENGGVVDFRGVTGAAGVIEATGAGSSVVLAGTYSLNNGATASGGGSVTFNGNWTNAGTITLDSGTLNAGGSFATAAIGTVDSNSGVVRITGQCDNTGATLDFAGADLRLRGWVTGGTIGGTEVVAEPGNTTLTNLVMDADFLVQGVASTTSVTFNGATTVATGGVLHLAGSWNNVGGITVDSGTLNVGGTVNLSQLGTITRLGSATVNLSGTLSVPGAYAWTSTGAFNAIVGGVLVADEVQVATGETVNITGGGLRTDLISGGGTVRLRGSDASLGTGIAPDETITIGSGVTVEAVSGTNWFQWGEATGLGAINNGIIRTTGSANLHMMQEHFVNNGLVESAGGQLFMGGLASRDYSRTWVNNGVLKATDGYLFLKGSTTTADLGIIERSGPGEVVLDARVDNTGSTLTIGEGAIEAYLGESAIIVGGTLTTALGSGPFRSAGRYEGVTVVGDVAVQDLTIADGTRILSNLHLADASSLFVSGANTFEGATVNLTSDTFFSEISLQQGARLVIDADSTVRGGRGLIRVNAVNFFNSDTLITNHGLISADVSGKRIDIDTRRFISDGTLEAVNGGTLGIGRSNSPVEWSNSGLIRADGGTVELGGIVTLLSGTVLDGVNGSIQLRGILDNSDSTLSLDDTTGSLTVWGGTVRGGTVNTSGSAELLFQANSVLDNVTVSGNMRTANNATIRIRDRFTQSGVTHLEGSGSSLIMEGDGVIESGTIAFESSGARARILASANQPATLTIGEDAVVRGGNGLLLTNAGSTIVNEGRISADVAGQTIQIHLTRFFNVGILESINGGAMELIPPGGSMPGEFARFLNTGIMTVGSGSSFLMSGELMMDFAGTLNVTLGAADVGAESGKIQASSAIEMGGLLNISFDAGFVAYEGLSFDLFDTANLRGGFDRMYLPELSGDLQWNLAHFEHSGIVRVVPAPASFLVLLALAAPRRTRDNGRSL